MAGNEPAIASTASAISSALQTSPGPLTAIPVNSFTVGGYNAALTAILGDLGSLYAESFNLWSILKSITAYVKNSGNTLITAIQALENQTGLAYTGESSVIGNYTDTLIQNITPNTPVETGISFYQNGDIPISLIDPNDNLMKLPVQGEFKVKLSGNGSVPSSVFLDRVAGRPVSVGNMAPLAFDGDPSTFWNETIHADAPIYCTINSFPWLPMAAYGPLGYKGGAACRLKIEFEKTTQVSEISIKPYGSHPMNLIGVGYVDGVTNSLQDPTFSSGIVVTPSTAVTGWWIDTPGNGTGSLNYSGGPLGEPSVTLQTYVPSGSVILRQTGIPVSAAGSLEVSFMAQTWDDTPILVSIAFVSSGNVTLITREELINVQSIGWSRIVTSFDAPPQATSINIGIGLPAYFKLPATLNLCSIFLEPVKQEVRYEPIVNDTTIYLSNSVMAKRLYLTFSQENATFVSYSLPPNSVSERVQWNRLSRLSVSNPDILDWDTMTNRSQGLSVISPATVSSPLAPILRQLPGTSWALVQDLENYASPPAQASYSAYEYNMGAYEITLRHREYAPQSRYVSPPLAIPGEIREIRLGADDSVTDGVTSPGSIQYAVTLFPDDAPEKGIGVRNVNLGGQTILGNANSTPPAIPYLNPTSWTAGGTGFMTTSWPSQTPFSISSAYLLIQSAATESRQVQTVYVQNNMSAPINLSGALSIVGSYALFTNVSVRMVMEPITFTLAFSSDGVNWDISTDITATPVFRNWTSPTLSYSQFSMDLSSIPESELASIQYMRVSTSWGRGFPVWLAIGNIEAEMVSVSTFTTLNIYPSDNIPSTYLPGQSFIAPVRGKTETINGSDRYGRVVLSDYPYFNSLTMLNLMSILSSNLNGQLSPYDPNALNPVYLNSNGSLGFAQGYRPITVSLYFPNTQMTVQPDILGKPKPMDFAQSTYELLSPATLSQSSSSSTQTLNLVNAYNGSTQINTPVSQSVSTVRNLALWQTQYQNIASGPYGVNIQAWWSNGVPSGDVKINPMMIAVNPALGTVQIIQPPPPGYSQVRATYVYLITETSPRENFYGAQAASGATLGIVPQNYPVTRNMTDYVNGTVPILTPSNLDPLDPNYYPVFEYAFDKNGYLIFGDTLFQYGNLPAIITVNYQTLAINPRVTINLSRSDTDTSETPYVRDYTLYMNIRRG
jgi:hypothetical protein